MVRFGNHAALLEVRIDTHAPLQVVGVDKAQFETLLEEHAPQISQCSDKLGQLLTRFQPPYLLEVFKSNAIFTFVSPENISS